MAKKTLSGRLTNTLEYMEKKLDRDQYDEVDALLENKDGNAFFPIFSKCGWKTVIEYDMAAKPPKLLKDASDGGEVVLPAGLTVYFETPHKVFGHVGCSLGDGTMISQNSVIPADASKVTNTPFYDAFDLAER